MWNQTLANSLWFPNFDSKSEDFNICNANTCFYSSKIINPNKPTLNVVPNKNYYDVLNKLDSEYIEALESKKVDEFKNKILFDQFNKLKLFREYKATSYEITSKKIQLYPTKEQKYHLKQIIGVYKYFYNQTVSYLNDIYKKRSGYKKQIDENETKIKELKKQISKNKKDKIKIDGFKKQINEGKIKGDELKKQLKEYQDANKTIASFIRDNKKKIFIDNYLNTIKEKINNINIYERKLPSIKRYIISHVIDQAIKECCNAYVICMKKYKLYGEVFNLRFKSRKKPSICIALEQCYFSQKENKIFPSIIKEEIKSSENFSNLQKKDSKILHDRILNKWFLLLPIESFDENMIMKRENDFNSGDLGTRTFYTGYSQKEVVKIGDNFIETIRKKQKQIDAVISKKDKTKNKRQKKIYEKVIKRKKDKNKNMITDLHFKTIKYLTSNFRTIICPPLKVNQMAEKANNNGNHQLARDLHSLNHGLFKKRLIYKCKRLNINCILPTESYTTMTCTICGIKNEEIGSKKIHECKNCGIKKDRDINGSRNNAIMNSEMIEWSNIE